MAAACSWPEAAEVAAAEAAGPVEPAGPAELAPAAELAAAAASWLARAAEVAAYPGDGAAGAKSHYLTAGAWRDRAGGS